MNRSAKRVAIVALIIAASILLGFAVDLIWTKLEQSSHPDRYMEYVSKYAYEYNVPEPVILAVIKVESDFNAGAVSRAGAKGLMQMTDSTFEWLCEIRGMDGADVWDPHDNIDMGTYYLSTLIKRYGDIPTALAAYNGGPSNVDRWLLDSEHSDDGKTLHSAGYAQTDIYMKKVMFFKNVYKLIYLLEE